MAGLNFDASYEFDPRTNGGRRTSDLLEMLQRAMEEQNSQQQKPGYMPRPGASPADNFGAPSGGLLGRFLALQAAQQQPRSFGGGRGRMPSAPADPNFRQLVRVSPAVQPQSEDGASSRPSTFGDGIPPDVLPTSDQGSENLARIRAGRHQSSPASGSEERCQGAQWDLGHSRRFRCLSFRNGGERHRSY